MVGHSEAELREVILRVLLSRVWNVFPYEVLEVIEEAVNLGPSAWWHERAVEAALNAQLCGLDDCADRLHRASLLFN